jgi:hypothetical protein
MTPAERKHWTDIRDAWEEKILAKAKKAGRNPVVDCTAKNYPVPPAILAELSTLDRPEVREAAFRLAAQQRRKAESLRSLAVMLETKGGATEGTLAKANALEQAASESEALHRV